MKGIQSLVSEFAKHAAAHGAATEQGDWEECRVAYDEKMRVLAELKAANCGDLSVLKELLHHGDDSVRSSAARVLLWFCEEESVRTLEDVVEGKGFVGFDARMVLQEWRKGSLAPP